MSDNGRPAKKQKSEGFFSMFLGSSKKKKEEVPARSPPMIPRSTFALPDPPPSDNNDNSLPVSSNADQSVRMNDEMSGHKRHRTSVVLGKSPELVTPVTTTVAQLPASASKRRRTSRVPQIKVNQFRRDLQSVVLPENRSLGPRIGIPTRRVVPVPVPRNLQEQIRKRDDATMTNVTDDTTAPSSNRPGDTRPNPKWFDMDEIHHKTANKTASEPVTNDITFPPVDPLLVQQSIVYSDTANYDVPVKHPLTKQALQETETAIAKYVAGRKVRQVFTTDDNVDQQQETAPTRNLWETFAEKAKNTWKCSVCCLQNELSRTKCVSCENERSANGPAGSAGAAGVAVATGAASAQINSDGFVFQPAATSDSKPPPAFGGTSKGALSFGGTTAAPTFGSTTAPAPFGSSTAPAPFGSTTAPAPFGSTTAPAPFGSSTAPAPFGSTTAPAPFGSTTAPAPSGGFVFGGSATASKDDSKKPPPVSFGDSKPAFPIGGSSSSSSSTPGFTVGGTASSDAQKSIKESSTPMFGSSETSKSAPTFGNSENSKPTPTFGSLQPASVGPVDSQPPSNALVSAPAPTVQFGSRPREDSGAMSLGSIASNNESSNDAKSSTGQKTESSSTNQFSFSSAPPASNQLVSEKPSDTGKSNGNTSSTPAAQMFGFSATSNQQKAANTKASDTPSFGSTKTDGAPTVPQFGSGGNGFGGSENKTSDESNKSQTNGFATSAAPTSLMFGTQNSAKKIEDAGVSINSVDPNAFGSSSGANPFGATNTQGNAFGGSSNSTSNPFGGSNVAPSNQGGSSLPSTAGFGPTVNSGPLAPNGTAKAPNAFGAGSTGSGFGFGAPSSGFGSSAPNSTFGAPAPPSGFGGTQAANAPASSFGGSSGFGGTSGFGGPSAPGAQTPGTFGGSSTPAPASGGFGGPINPAPGHFGATSAFPPASSAFPQNSSFQNTQASGFPAAPSQAFTGAPSSGSTTFPNPQFGNASAPSSQQFGSMQATSFAPSGPTNPTSFGQPNGGFGAMNGGSNFGPGAGGQQSGFSIGKNPTAAPSGRRIVKARRPPKR